MSSQNQPLLRFLCLPPVMITLVVLTIHSRAVWFPLVRDDVWQIERLPAEVSTDLLANAWTTDHWGGHSSGAYRPLLHTFWIAQAAVGGEHREMLVRLVNLALTIGVALLFHAFLRRMGIGPPVALIASLVPVVHVSSVEIVTQGVGQGELITTLLTLICLRLTCDLRGGAAAAWRIGLITLFMLIGTLIKETMFPALIVCPALLLAARPLPKRRAATLATCAGLVFVAVFAVRLMILGGNVSPTENLQVFAGFSPLERAMTALALSARYALAAVIPLRPEVDYQFLVAEFPPTTLWRGAGLATVVASVGAAIALARTHRRAPVALLWVALTLGLVVQIIPVGTVFGMRHLWPAIFPMAWAGAWVIEHLGRQRWLMALAALWLVANGALAYLHVSEHRSGVVLWRAAAERHPENHVPHQSLAVHLIIDAARGEDADAMREEARRHLDVALAITTENSRVWATLGRLELDERNFDAARNCIDRALALDPDNTAALFNLGVLHTTQSQWDEARACWERVVETEPLYPNAQLFLSRLPEE